MPFVWTGLSCKLACVALWLGLWAPGVQALSPEQQRSLHTVQQLIQQSRPQAQAALDTHWQKARQQQDRAFQLALLAAQCRLNDSYWLAQALRGCASQGLALSAESGQAPQQRWFALYRANAEALVGHYAEAFAAHKALVAQAPPAADPQWLVQAQLALARSRINLGQMDTATRELNALLQKAEQRGDADLVAAVHRARADVHYQLQAYAVALGDYRAALQAEPTEALQARARHSVGVAQMLNVLGEREAALAELAAARASLQAVDDPVGLAYADLLEGYFQRKAGRPAQAQAPYLRALAGYKALNDPLALSSIHAHLSGLYIELGRPATAVAYAREAVAMADARQDVSMQWDAHGSLANALAAAGQFEAAFAHKHKAERALLKRARLDVQSETNRLREEFGAERRQQQNEVLTERLRLEAARLQAEERMTAALTGLLLVAGAALAWSVWMYRRTRALAQRDGLTGLANRRTLLAHAQRERVRALRYQQPVSLVMLDLDLFKQLNDSHGHAAGDRALKHVAELCRQLLRESDVAGRIGGEEFALVLANTDAAGALQLAERLRERLAGSATPDWPAGGLTASFGVAQHQASDATLEIWFARADQALYVAKHGGRNRCSVAEDPAPSGP
jgi:diguanylate cyclase (GGDEF)-like protein